jgi:hypothetical protein
MSEPMASVPKFGSFRPKPKQSLPGQVEVKDKSKIKNDNGSREESRGHHERHRSRRSRSKEHRRDRSNDRQTSRNHWPLIETRQSPPPLKDEAVEIFIIDKKGDLKNLEYGSIHRYSVPPFHRAGAGSVLGIPSNVKIDRDYGDEKSIVLSDRRAFKLHSREKYIFSKIEKERPRLMKIRPEIAVESAAIQEVDFVPLQTSRRKKQKRGVDGDSSGLDDGVTNYRSIHGKSRAKMEPEDESFQYATGSESSGSETGRAIRLDSSTSRKTVELSRKIEQMPHNISAWLALIGHQDMLIRAEGDRRRITNAEIRSTADIKIHMFEAALEKARSLEDRETLLLGLMTEGAKIWEVKTQSEKWEQISKDNIDSLVLWKSYLNFKQTAFGTFQYEEVRDIFVRRIKLLLKAADADSSHALHHQVVYILLRLTIFIRESGYTELAVAIWQGLLEFNFFAPFKSISPGVKIECFKQFWESEVPRIGEDAAMGWRHFVDNEGASEAPDALNDEEGNQLDNTSLFQSWTAAEHPRSRVSRIPAKTMDGVVEDDPFRVILISDIEELLIPFPSESDELRTALLDAFLLFCRLPPTGSLDKVSRGWSSDPFIGGNLLESDSAWTRRRYFLESDRPGEEGYIDASSIFQTPPTNFQSSSESRFTLSWFKGIPAWRDTYDGDNGPVQYKWLRNSLKQLLQGHFIEDLAEYYLAFEWRNEPETIKKVSKSLLKQNPSSLRLYNAYAMIEWSRENRDVANSVFSAALDMSNSMPEHDRDASVILWKSWIWGYLEAIDNRSALNRLLSIESGTHSYETNMSPFQLLKTRQYLEQRRDYHLYSSGQLRFAIIYAELLALLSYLTSNSGTETHSSTQGDISAALAVYTNFSHMFDKTLVDRKILDTSYRELFLQVSHSRILSFLILPDLAIM